MTLSIPFVVLLFQIMNKLKRLKGMESLTSYTSLNNSSVETHVSMFGLTYDYLIRKSSAGIIIKSADRKSI